MDMERLYGPVREAYKVFDRDKQRIAATVRMVCEQYDDIYGLHSWLIDNDVECTVNDLQFKWRAADMAAGGVQPRRPDDIRWKQGIALAVYVEAQRKGWDLTTLNDWIGSSDNPTVDAFRTYVGKRTTNSGASGRLRAISKASIVEIAASLDPDRSLALIEEMTGLSFANVDEMRTFFQSADRAHKEDKVRRAHVQGADEQMKLTAEVTDSHSKLLLFIERSVEPLTWIASELPTWRKDLDQVESAVQAQAEVLGFPERDSE